LRLGAMAEIVLGTLDFVLLVVAAVGVVILILVIALEYHYWRMRRLLKGVIRAPGAG